MKITQIRNATLKITYGNRVFLIDPWLQDVGAVPPFGKQNTIPNPTVPLPLPVFDIIKGVDAYIVTHVHPDHFDMKELFARNYPGGQRLNKFTKLFVQNEEDRQFCEFSGFSNIEILSEQETVFGNVKLIKTPGIHGTKLPAGEVMGVIFKNPSEKTLYLAGDTVYCPLVEDTLLQYRPDIVVVNACAAYADPFGRLIMNGDDLIKIHNLLPDAILIASHMEAVNHAGLTRADLRQQMEDAGISDWVKIPADGESYDF